MALTKQLKSCRSAQNMLSAIREYSTNNHRPTDTMHLGAIYTRLPTIAGSLELKLEVIKEVGPDLEHAVE